jgi:hypothetical protein
LVLLREVIGDKAVQKLSQHLWEAFLLQESAKGLADILDWEKRNPGQEVTIHLWATTGQGGHLTGYIIEYYINDKGTGYRLPDNYRAKIPKRLKDDPVGVVNIESSSRGTGPCLGAMEVVFAQANHGWGPLLYDVALEFATKYAGGLMSDRTSVTKYAKKIWNYYADNRSDVKKQQLDTLYTPPEKLTPKNPKDDCRIDIAMKDVGQKDPKSDAWVQSNLSKVFKSNGTPTINALKKAGKYFVRGLLQKIQEELKKGAKEITREEIIAAVRAGKSLAGADLQEADFRKAYLQEANFQKANLQRANFWSAALQRVNFREANLQETDFRRAQLLKADLHEADLRKADLRKASLVKANLHEADLRGANIFYMDAKGAKTTGIKLSWVPKKGDSIKTYAKLDGMVLGILLEDPDPDRMFDPVSVRLRDKEIKISITDMKPASRLEEIIQEELKKELGR